MSRTIKRDHTRHYRNNEEREALRKIARGKEKPVKQTRSNERAALRKECR